MIIRLTRSFATLALAFLMFASFSIAQDSKPGLVVTYSDANTKLSRVVALPNLVLQASESVHPQIGRTFSAEWNGVLKIGRAGKYRVFVEGSKTATVQLNGKSIDDLNNLTTGEHPLRISFQRNKGDARIELRWQSEFFRNEPVPSAVLRHIGTPPELVEQDSIEHGRLLFAELGCNNCHAASDWKMQSRRGPDLTSIGSRVNAGWLFEWLKNPHNYRKSAVMPVCLDTDQDRADVTAFMMSLKSADTQSGLSLNPQQVETGRMLFDQIGCKKCHDKQNNLDAVGSKYASLDKLADFVANPHTTDPHGRMPQLFRETERHQARSVAAFLFNENKLDEPHPRAPSGDAARGAKLFATNGCASCHTANSAAVDKDAVLKGPVFGQSAALALRHFWNFGSDNKPNVQDHVTGRTEKVSGPQKLVNSGTDRGSAFEFNGKSFIEIPHFHRPDTMTISVWVKTTQGGSIITWGRPGGQLRGSRELRINIREDGKNSICYGEYNSDGGWKPVVVRPKDVNLIDGQWHHIAVVRKGESIKHFVDGKLKGGGNAQKGGGDYTDRLLIGALGLSARPTNYFKGQIDDLSVWEMALSANQIERLANGDSVIDMATPEKQEIKAFDVAGGCLSQDVQRPLPDYQLDDSKRVALQQFLKTVQPQGDGTKSVYQDAPLVLHDLRIQQFGCVKCHEMNDQNIQKGVAVDEKGRMIRLERPPRLTGAGTRLTASWLHDVLLEKKRNRPWLNLRMPHFGEAVSELPLLISSSAGVTQEAAAPKPDRSLAAAGLEMIGVRRGKISCITCHDYRGINRRKDGVVPAPDLAEAGRTVRHDWFARWMHDPQRLEPGTSMPQLFLDVSSDERELRIAQLWSALYYQKDLPLPKGVLDQKTEGTRIVVNDTPVIFRMATLTPAGQIDRAINVGLPGGLNFTFDAVTCRLKYAWKGSFLDAGPAWNGRGGNPVKAGGEPLVTLKTGNSLRVGNATDVPLPRFLGYRLEKHMPVFRYRIGEAIVEHRIGVSNSHIIQKFLVKGATANVFYAGDAETNFKSKTGKRVGNTIGYQKADVVEFEITMPLSDTASK